MRGTNIGSMRNGSGFTNYDAAQSFLDAFDGSGVREAQIAGRPEGFSRYDSYMGLLQQHLRDFRAGFCERWPSRAVRKVRGNIRERIERATRPFASDAGEDRKSTRLNS